MEDQVPPGKTVYVSSIHVNDDIPFIQRRLQGLYLVLDACYLVQDSMPGHSDESDGRVVTVSFLTLQEVEAGAVRISVMLLTDPRSTSW